jgi:integrase
MEANDMPATDLCDAEVRKLLRRASDGAATARARFGSVSRFLDWCQDSGHIKANPCALIARGRRPKAPAARAHYLVTADLVRLWEAAGGLREPVWRDLARFLIVVPCRRGEASRAEWLHIDLVAAEWRQPGHMTKNRDPHRIHLHSLALEVLRERQRATGGNGMVFPAPTSGRAVDTFSDIKTELEEITGLGGWTWHRSFATALGEASIPEAVADAVLNHRQSATRGGVLGVYQRASRWPEQVRAMTTWGNMLADALARSDATRNVVPNTRTRGIPRGITLSG